MQEFAVKQIAKSLDDNLLADVQRSAAGLSHICVSGSIKGCLMFVQKEFDLIGFSWQEMSELGGALNRRRMYGNRLMELVQTEVDASFEGFFDGREL